MRPDQHFSQDAAPAPIPTPACSADRVNRVSGPYPRRTFAGAITNASAQAPDQEKSMAPNRVRSVTRRYTSFENRAWPRARDLADWWTQPIPF